jgi:hypothetical protein
LAIAFPDFIKALKISLGLEIKKVNTSLIIVVLFDLKIAEVIKI